MYTVMRADSEDACREGGLAADYGPTNHDPL